ncbi:MULTISPECIES: response regulator transcription factor [Clostridium]|uniref:Stage 0 sporulation protein A homolog n=3 Tax=Clostridium TaxID=1485 RepID=D8GRA7_CLOLD|nr:MULTISPECIES: response regulator transcription factor [Clostridium]ADK14245.1 two-component response regulator [Clostridium ljungdahlii DSM 13528]AGY77471.1 response regulator transcription factor [Clostridium autoethanogenum DSM 10061]ALU37612.1 Two component transcriptional regulator [Clostridium autoethanogenum DSM 10061]OAA86078.1 Transcriptional regulatory protein WalR [Clostridium ljungdahlii DSM 13528]OVY49259.1 Transcriptional regulatory protein WalR [Clostridium autoethanogenum]
MEKEIVLVVDDEKEIRDLVEIYLVNEGYKVLKASDGLEALQISNDNEVDLVILDIMMPKMDGIEVCMRMRKSKNMPIIMLSAKSQDLDKILGLTTGADDYVVKPFNPLELVARVKSQLRRYKRLNVPKKVDQEVIEVDDLMINTKNHQVKVGNKDVKLTPREFEILELLSSNRGVVFSIEKIYESVWKQDFFESDNTVMVHIRKIREKIEENPRRPRFIKTIWGVGYKVEK